MTHTRKLTRLTLLLALALCVVGVLILGGALRPAKGAGSGPKLPNLVADEPNALGLSTDSSTGTPHLLLRFNGYIHNRGPGAVDIRGTRIPPKLSAQVEAEVKKAEKEEKALSEPIEKELAKAPMEETQRIFTTNVGEEETNIEREHITEKNPAAQVIFSSADGHHHWHLQHAAKYSLWNVTKTNEVAPAQKVGFCLDDSFKQHVEPKIGPEEAAYSDATGRDFCQKYKPNATTLFEGISPGWRDLYGRELAFQWVDASEVQPGEYWLREEVNPEHVIIEAEKTNVPTYASEEVFIPGFDALAQNLKAQGGEANSIGLTSKAYRDSTTPAYKIVGGPSHGTLGAISKGQVTYTPTAGYAGPDSFTFEAYDTTSPFPKNPATATVSIEVLPEPSVTIEAPTSISTGEQVQLKAIVQPEGEKPIWEVSPGGGEITPEGLYTAPAEPPPGGVVTITADAKHGKDGVAKILILQPSVALEGAPVAMTAGTAVQLHAIVANDSPSVNWAATGGTITQEGLYTAPAAVPAGGTVTVTATTAKGAHGQATIAISPVPVPQPAPEAPLPNGGVLSTTLSGHAARLTRPTVTEIGRSLIMTTIPNAAGKIRLTAYVGKHRLGTCVTVTPAGRSFTCRLHLRARVSTHERVSVVASLRVGNEIIVARRPAGPIYEMRMTAMQGALAAIAAAKFWCSPLAGNGGSGNGTGY